MRYICVHVFDVVLDVNVVASVPVPWIHIESLCGRRDPQSARFEEARYPLPHTVFNRVKPVHGLAGIVELPRASTQDKDTVALVRASWAGFDAVDPAVKAATDKVEIRHLLHVKVCSVTATLHTLGIVGPDLICVDGLPPHAVATLFEQDPTAAIHGGNWITLDVCCCFRIVLAPCCATALDQILAKQDVHCDGDLADERVARKVYVREMRQDRTDLLRRVPIHIYYDQTCDRMAEEKYECNVPHPSAEYGWSKP